MTRTIPTLVLACTTIGCGPPPAGSAATDSGALVSESLGLVVSPDHVVLPVGATTQLEAIGLTEDREQLDLTAAVVWSSGAPEVAVVGDGLDEEGVVVAVSPGQSVVTAALDGGPPAEVRVDVTDATLEALWIDSASLVLEDGDEVRVRARAAFSDGSGGDVTRQVRWIVDDPSVARVDDGTVEAVGVGTTDLQVEWGGTTSERVVARVFPTGSLSAPDLVITTVDGFTRGGQASVDVTVENRGETTATGFFVDAYEGTDDPRVGSTGDGFVHVSELGPGTSTPVELTWESARPSPGVTVFVDSADGVAETREDNNLARLDLDPAPAGADLRIIWFGAHGSGDALTYEVQVENTGDETAEAVEIAVWMDRATSPSMGTSGDESLRIDALGPWERRMVYLQPGAPACTSCTSWAVVDSLDRIDEPDEGDNVAGPLSVMP